MNQKIEKRKKIDWAILYGIATVHLFGLVGIWYGITHFSWQTTILMIVWILATGFSITAGYHRHFNHQSYQTTTPLRLFFLIFGAAAIQGSVLQWVSNHKAHHASDTNAKIEDPHSIEKGFWWAHCIWLMYKMPPIHYNYVKKLRRDSLVAWQHKRYLLLILIFGFVLPASIACLWNDFLGGLLLVGALRTVMVWHMTWSVNSVAHTFGDNRFKRPDQSRNNLLLSILLVAFGELGGHNDHHQYPRAYRHGLKRYSVDPTGWLIWAWSHIRISKFRLAWDLVRIPEEKIAADVVATKKNASLKNEPLPIFTTMLSCR